jgi:hypothetical protein
LDNLQIMHLLMSYNTFNSEGLAYSLKTN